MSLKEILFGSDEELAADEAAREKKENGMITRDMLVGRLIADHPAAADFLMSCGMGCIFCPSAQMESLEQAAMVHGLDADDSCDALNDMLMKQAETDTKQESSDAGDHQD